MNFVRCVALVASMLVAPMVAGAVEISQPDAALKDPFTGDTAPEPATTGSINIQ